MTDVRRVLLAIILCPTICPAQTVTRDAGTPTHPSSSYVRVSVAAHDFDVLKYKLFMDWYDVLLDSSLSFDGVMQITLRATRSPIDSVSLSSGAPYLYVDSAFSGDKRVSFATSWGALNVRLDKTYEPADSAIVTLYYHVTNPGAISAMSQAGFYLYYGGQQLDSMYIVPQTVAYTMSEPRDARYWMPCYDDPSDKALGEITIRVPDRFTAASNGRLASRTENVDGSTTFDWVQNYPIATYLMCATASHFAVIQRVYVNTKGDSIPVQYYVYPEDSSEAESNSDCSIDTIVSMIKFYSSIYGDYAFDKYAMTGVEPFQYGGMEHTTITTLNRNHEFQRRYTAHELAHHWWGDDVTLGTWNDIWLNESFATYSEALQLKHDDYQSFLDEMQFYLGEYLAEYQSAHYAIYAPPPQYIFGLAEYYKGAWVLYMLNNLVGDSTFYAILNDYRSQFHFGTAVSSDFVAVVSKVTHADMSWFFNEWVFNEYNPVYSSTYAAGSGSFTFYLMQKQEGNAVFKMPVEIGVYSGGTMTTFNFVDSLKLQSARFQFSGKIDSVEFDPDNLLLKLTQPWSDSTLLSNGAPNSIVCYPNPTNGSAQLKYSVTSDGQVTIELYDMLGQKVRTLLRGYQQSGIYVIGFDGTRLASGVYYCRLQTDRSNSVAKLLLLK